MFFEHWNHSYFWPQIWLPGDYGSSSDVWGISLKIFRCIRQPRLMTTSNYAQQFHGSFMYCVSHLVGLCHPFWGAPHWQRPGFWREALFVGSWFFAPVLGVHWSHTWSLCYLYGQLSTEEPGRSFSFWFLIRNRLDTRYSTTRIKAFPKVRSLCAWISTRDYYRNFCKAVSVQQFGLSFSLTLQSAIQNCKLHRWANQAVNPSSASPRIRQKRDWRSFTKRSHKFSEIEAVDLTWAISYPISWVTN